MTSSCDPGAAQAPGPHGEIPRGTRSVATAALVLGGALLGVTVNAGDSLFYVSGFALAAIWGVASRVATRAPRRSPSPDDVVLGGLVGTGAFVAFVAAFAVVRHIALLDRQVGDLLDTADRSRLLPVIALALANAVTEEAFFRGTLVDAVRPRHRWIAGVVPYTVATVPSANVALVAAAAVMGSVFTWLRIRRHNVAAPLACHLTWSLLMLLAFPRP